MNSPRQRVRLAVVVLAACAVSAGVAFGLASHVKSTRQAAADAAPPTMPPLTAPVQKRVLEKDLVFRATVEPGAQVDVRPSGGVVTRLGPKVGQQVRAGQLLATVDDQPIFVLPGQIPLYRDLRDGDHGPDVARLDDALAKAGLLDGKPNDTVDATTEAALAALYRGAGLPTPGSGSLREIPKDLLVFVPVLPATVTAVGGALGQPVGDKPLYSLVSGDPYLHALLSADEAPLARVGASVSVDTGSGGVVQGAITRVGDEITDDKLGAVVPLRISADVPVTLIGADLRVTMATARTSSPTLVVPLAAVYSAGGGQAEVRVLRDGKPEPVAVTTGLEADGYLSITQVDGDLRAGDRVVIGQ